MGEYDKLVPPITRRQFIKGALATSAVIAAGSGDKIVRAENDEIMIELPDLPYPENSLEPFISERTIGFHYGKHHKAYVDNTIKLIKDTELGGTSLENIVKKTAGKSDQASIFNNAAQVWNHNFYWKSMKPNGGGMPKTEMADRIDKSFGSFEKFKEEFSNAALSQFGSGWAWLIMEGDNLKVTKTGNADTPLVHDQIALITVDVWEHAYYLDYQNRRKDYISDFIEHLANWDFAAENASL